MHRLYIESEWINANPACILISTLPGLTGLSVAPDWMHAKHLGTDQYLYGSTLHILVFLAPAATGDLPSNVVAIARANIYIVSVRERMLILRYVLYLSFLHAYTILF